MIKFGQWLTWFVIATVAICGGVVAFNYQNDPMQLMHSGEMFHKNQRYRTAGIAKHFPADIACIGTSHSENFSTRLMQRVFKGRAMLLALSGATAREEALIASLIAKHNQHVRQIIWEMHLFSFYRDPDAVRLGSDNRPAIPVHYYHSNLFNNFRYLLSFSTLNFSIEKQKALHGENSDFVQGLEGINNWYLGQKALFTRQNNLNRWDKMRENPSEIGVISYHKLKENFERHVLSVAQQHPHIMFDMFFPPYSLAFFYLIHELTPHAWEDYLKFKTFVFQKSLNMKNLTIFDFQSVDGIVDTWENYKDLMHYKQEVNHYMILALAARRHHVSRMNWASMVSDFQKKVESFDAQAFWTP
jgi:hypothetical protein